MTRWCGGLVALLAVGLLESGAAADEPPAALTGPAGSARPPVRPGDWAVRGCLGRRTRRRRSRVGSVRPDSR